MTLIPEQSAFTIRGAHTHTADSWIAGVVLTKTIKEDRTVASRRVRRQSRRNRYL